MSFYVGAPSVFVYLESMATEQSIRWNRAETVLAATQNLCARSRRVTDRVTSKCGRVAIDRTADDRFRVTVDGARLGVWHDLLGSAKTAAQVAA